MSKLILKIAYDGTQFHGWQTQKNVRTVQHVLAQAWESLTGKFEYPHGSGRTDAGVHACAQVASFELGKTNILPARYAAALNSYLPQDVRILESFLGPENFDARRCAISRTYFYDLNLAAHSLPQNRCYSLCLKRSALQLCRLNHLAKLFLGGHNFQAFSSAHDQNKNKIRTVYTSSFISLGQNHLRYQISANAFLMNMVRSIMGSLLYFHDDPHGEVKILNALQSGKKEHLGPTAPACGLSLVHVEYPATYTFLRS